MVSNAAVSSRQILIAIALTTLLGVFAAGFLGNKSGPSLSEARKAGIEAGRIDGSAKGAATGYRRGVRIGKARGEKRGYRRGYLRSFRSEYESAGYTAPASIDVPEAGL